MLSGVDTDEFFGERSASYLFVTCRGENKDISFRGDELLSPEVYPPEAC